MLVSVNSFEEKLGQPISIILEIVKHFYINMKTLLKNSEKKKKKKNVINVGYFSKQAS